MKMLELKNVNIKAMSYMASLKNVPYAICNETNSIYTTVRKHMLQVARLCNVDDTSIIDVIECVPYKISILAVDPDTNNEYTIIKNIIIADDNISEMSDMNSLIIESLMSISKNHYIVKAVVEKSNTADDSKILLRDSISFESADILSSYSIDLSYMENINILNYVFCIINKDNNMKLGIDLMNEYGLDVAYRLMLCNDYEIDDILNKSGLKINYVKYQRAIKNKSAVIIADRGSLSVIENNMKKSNYDKWVILERTKTSNSDIINNVSKFYKPGVNPDVIYVVNDVNIIENQPLATKYAYINSDNKLVDFMYYLVFNCMTMQFVNKSINSIIGNNLLHSDIYNVVNRKINLAVKDKILSIAKMDYYSQCYNVIEHCNII